MGSRLRVERTSRRAGGFQRGARGPVGRGQRRWLQQRSALTLGAGQEKRPDPLTQTLTPQYLDPGALARKSVLA